MPRPFEIASADLQDHLEKLVDATFGDIQSQLLVLPRSDNFVEYQEFQNAYEVLRRRTDDFADSSEGSVWTALRENSPSLVVVRTMLGLSPPEWADLARSDRDSDVTQGYSRNLEGRCRKDHACIGRLVRPRNAGVAGNAPKTAARSTAAAGGKHNVASTFCIAGRQTSARMPCDRKALATGVSSGETGPNDQGTVPSEPLAPATLTVSG